MLPVEVRELERELGRRSGGEEGERGGLEVVETGRAEELAAELFVRRFVGLPVPQLAFAESRRWLVELGEGQESSGRNSSP